jgi:hypothetical protein
LKQEFKLLKNIIRDYTDPDYTYNPEYGTRKAKKTDYDKVDIIPVSDPNAATMSQRVIQYQAVIQMAQMAPDIYNLPELHRGMLNVLGIKNAEKLVPIEEDMKPIDPVQENQNALKGTPLKAFLHQDHQSHIQVHMMLLQDPMIQQFIGQNPQAQKIMGAITAHIAEHVGFKMRQQIEQQLGMPLPPEDEKLPPQIEIALSGMMAQAANQVLQQNQAQAAQMQAQQQAQDPIMQMQMQELQLRGQELELKKQKIMMDAAAKADAQQLKEQEVSGRLELDALKVGAQIRESQAKAQFEQERAGIQMGVDVAKGKEQQLMDNKRMALQHISTFKQGKPTK